MSAKGTEDAGGQYPSPMATPNNEPTFPPAKLFQTHGLGSTAFIDFHARLLEQRADIAATTMMTKDEAAFYTAAYRTAKAEWLHDRAMWAVLSATADLNLVATVERRWMASAALVGQAQELLRRTQRLRDQTRMQEVIGLCKDLVGESDDDEATTRGRRWRATKDTGSPETSPD